MVSSHFLEVIDKNDRNHYNTKIKFFVEKKEYLYSTDKKLHYKEQRKQIYDCLNLLFISLDHFICVLYGYRYR